MASHRGIDYSLWTKRSFLFGVGLFALAALVELLAHAFVGQLPGWEETLLLDAEILGVVIALLSPFVIGIVLPLTE